ncbi:MAG: hypothetical protein FWF76_06720 [Oscillospiraceae bacterium]|nr:hypothetical protein [Oscillospiraceae bacterium]
MKSSKSTMEKMLNTASRNLGMSAEELKGLLTKGDVNAIMAKMNDKDAQKLKDALDDPNVTKNIKDSPEMAKYMEDIKKTKD